MILYFYDHDHPQFKTTKQKHGCLSHCYMISLNSIVLFKVQFTGLYHLTKLRLYFINYKNINHTILIGGRSQHTINKSALKQLVYYDILLLDIFHLHIYEELPFLKILIPKTTMICITIYTRFTVKLYKTELYG